ncbi:myosin light chain kinase, smooth muscle-like isoform X2 [Saccostrea cucullata]|uniref:myosin light chain kinase, smooth muscle-like isoform X2 n=1 Tax=Saccostrea cuccullata TaxID=36930 RepID=UPI002ECFF7E0
MQFETCLYYAEHSFSCIFSDEFHVDPVSKRLIRDRKSADRKSLDRKAGKPEKAPEFVTKPRRQFTDEGQTAKFKASYEGPPGTKLLWTFNGMVLSNDTKHKIYQEKDVHWLEVCDVTKDDTGLYTCTIQNATGSSQASAELEVLVKPKPVSKKGFVAPEVDIPLSDQYITPDQKSVVLECKFSNAIDANTTWYKDGRKLNSGYFAKQTFDGRLARLTLNKVSEREMGTYECVASNSGGEAKTWAQLSYKVAGSRSIPPKFAVPLTNQTLSPGDQLTLESTVTGYPKPSIKWYKNNKEIHSSKAVKMEFDGSKVRLTVSNVQTSDSDSYKCVAENEAGQDKIKADVSVIVPSSAAPDDFKEPPVFVKELVDMEANDGDRVELAVQVEEILSKSCMQHNTSSESSYPHTYCESESERSLKSDSGYLTEKSYQKPDFILKPHTVEVKSGGSAIFLCRVTGFPTPNIVWTTNGRTINNDDQHKISFGEDCVLEIRNASQSDSGIYTCTLTNPAGAVSMDARLIVNGSDVSSNPPSRVPPLHQSVHTRVVEEKIEQQVSPNNMSSRRDSKPNTPETVKNSYVPKQLSNNSVSERIEKLRKLEHKPPKSHEVHDFRGVLKSKPASSEKIDYRSVLKHKSNNDLTKVGLTPEKKHSAGPELGTDFREILSQRKKSREEQLKLHSDRKASSFSGSKRDNSSSPTDFRSVLGRKRNSVPKESSPTVNRDNGFSLIKERPPVSGRQDLKETTTDRVLPLKSEPALSNVTVKQDIKETSTFKNVPPKSQIIDNKSSSVPKDTVQNSASELISKFDTPEKVSYKSQTYQQTMNERTPEKGRQSVSPSPRRRRASPAPQGTTNTEPPSEEKVQPKEELAPPPHSVEPPSHSMEPPPNSEPLSLSEKPPTLSTEPPSFSAEPPSQPPVLTDVMDEVDIESLLAKRRQKRRQSPAHKDFIPPDQANIVVNIPVSLPVNIDTVIPESQKHGMEKSEVNSKDKIDMVPEQDRNKTEDLNSYRKTDEKSVIAGSKVTSEKSKSNVSDHLVENKEEDFRTVLANRKNRNANSFNDSPNPKEKNENESSDILRDWREKRQQQNWGNKEGVNGEVNSTVKLDSVAQETTKSKEDTVKTRPPLSKMNLNLNINRNENLPQNGSVKTPENYSDDFRSILSRKRRTSNSFSKYDANNAKSPSSPKTTDFRHVLTRHVSYVENRHRQAPTFNSRLRDKTVTEGEAVTMECHITGVPRPEITWTMNNNQIKPSKFFRMTYDDNHIARLVIAGAYPEDDGVYVCYASNSSGNESSTCHLFVKELASTTDHSEEERGMQKGVSSEEGTCTEDDDFADTLEAPVIHEINPSTVNTTPGQKITIQASFTSDEKPTIEWRKGTSLLKTDDSISVNSSEHFSRLTLNQVKVTDAGKYEITVTNSIGQASAMSTVNVQDVPGQVPGPPYASDVNLRSVILSWGCPSSDGGTPVTGYRVEMCEAERDVWQTLTEQCHSTSYHIANLLPHTPYFFRVAAKNKHGYGKPSETSSVIVTKDRRSSLRLSVDSDEEDLPFEPKIVTLQEEKKFEEDYDLQDVIGKGKFGKVHKCLEKASGKTFAAKVVKCRTQKEKENLKQEVEIMNCLTHPKLLMLWDAFETARSVVLVMEYVSGGELFDRVADEDLELTECDCVHFMRQICQGLQYMHLKSILHLDLKPENILCINKDNNLIKIIDFGLARRHKEGESLRVMFGTPEFIAPEVVNYEEIGFPTDIWSVGVICYVLLSGLSPFMGDSDVETLSNVTRGDYDFDDEAFDEISDLAKDFINKTIKLNKKKRLTIDQCLDHPWVARSERNSSKKLRQSLRNLKQFMARRKWQKMGNAIRAVGRISMLQKSRSGSESSVQSDSDVSSQTDNSTLSSSRPSSIGSEDKSDLRQTKSSKSTVSNTPIQQTIPSHKPHSVHGDRTEEISEQTIDTQLTFLKEMVDCEAFIGDNARFDVKIGGNTKLPPSVQWYHEEEIIQTNGQYSVIDSFSENGEYSLIVKNVGGSTEGEYTCRVTSGDHVITCSADLILNDAGTM